MIIISKDDIGPVKIVKDGTPITCQSLHFEMGVNDEEILFLEIDGMRCLDDDIEIYLKYKNIHLLGAVKDSSLRIENVFPCDNNCESCVRTPSIVPEDDDKPKPRPKIDPHWTEMTKASQKIVKNRLDGTIRIDRQCFKKTMPLVQHVMFHYHIDEKPTLQIKMNLWDDEDYNQAARQSMNEI